MRPTASLALNGAEVREAERGGAAFRKREASFSFVEGDNYLGPQSILIWRSQKKHNDLISCGASYLKVATYPETVLGGVTLAVVETSSVNIGYKYAASRATVNRFALLLPSSAGRRP